MDKAKGINIANSNARTLRSQCRETKTVAKAPNDNAKRWTPTDSGEEMELHESEPERRYKPDDNGQPDEVVSRARVRVADLLQRAFDVRSVALTGLFILAI